MATQKLREASTISQSSLKELDSLSPLRFEKLVYLNFKKLTDKNAILFVIGREISCVFLNFDYGRTIFRRESRETMRILSADNVKVKVTLLSLVSRKRQERRENKGRVEIARRMKLCRGARSSILVSAST